MELAAADFAARALLSNGILSSFFLYNEKFPSVRVRAAEVPLKVSLHFALVGTPGRDLTRWNDGDGIPRDRTSESYNVRRHHDFFSRSGT